MLVNSTIEIKILNYSPMKYGDLNVLNRIIKIKIVIVFIFVLLVPICHAQQQAEIEDSIYSNILKEQRNIKIKLPVGYKPDSTDKYEVIYITDGEWNMDLFSYIYNFLKGENFVPPVILVGVCNSYIDGENMRERDFPPEQTAGSKLTGGADKFIGFLKNELIPYINSKYPSNGVNSIYGHSLGGLFAVYVLLKNPGLFDTYYCIDPDLVWNNNFITRRLIQTFKNLSVLDKTLWIAGGGSNYINLGIGKLDTVMREHAPEKLYWKTVYYGYETHRSVRLKGIYDGLKFAYEGFNAANLEYHPMGGILLRDKPVQILINGCPNLYYTTDGTTPTEISKKTGAQIEVTGPAILRLKYLSTKRKIDVPLKGVFEIGEIFASVSKSGTVVKGGLNYKYYEGKWKKLPDFNKIKPVKAGVIDSVFNVGNIQDQNNFACLLTGYLQVEKDGYYIFGMDSSDGSKLYINNRLLIDHDGLHQRGKLKSYVVPLQKGFHSFRIEYFRQDGPASLGLIYRTPDMSEAGIVPPALFYYER